MNAQEIKEALNGRAEEFVRWLFPAGRKNGHEWKVGSLQGEEGNSLSICIEGSKTGVFCDFATGDKGDNLIELYTQATRVGFKDALHACADWLSVSVTQGHARQVSSRRQPDYTAPFPTEDDLLSKDQCLKAVRMITALRNDIGLCERIAKARGWKVETIQALTKEPSLGWHDGKFVFVYETGVKFRYREKGQRVIKWVFGSKPWIWRSFVLPDAERVYLCEGETDAISLIDAGVEQRPNTFAVALPSATFDERWAESFRGKDVILVLDGDKAGMEATAKISNLLRGCARSLKQLNWGAVQHAIAS